MGQKKRKQLWCYSGCIRWGRGMWINWLFMLSLLSKHINKNHIGLFRDDGLAILKNTSGPEAGKLKKKFHKFFNLFGTAKAATNGNHRLPKIETTSKVSLKFPSRINLGRRGARAELSTLDTAHNPVPPPPRPPPSDTVLKWWKGLKNNI